MNIEFDTDGEFDRIMEEIEPSSIPTQYLKSVAVTFITGKEIEISGEELLNPLPVASNFSWEQVVQQFKQISDVSIIIDVEKFQNHVYTNSNEILSTHFQPSAWRKPDDNR